MKFNMDTAKAIAMSGASALLVFYLLGRFEAGKKLRAAALAG